MKEKFDFGVMRHSYDDHSYIDGKNDTDLTKDGIQIAKDAAKQIAKSLGEQDQEIQIRSSSKRRGIHTAEIVKEQLDKDMIPNSLIVDENLRELYQGNMDLSQMSHDERVRFLESGWQSFDDERKKGNDNYHFGEPHIKLMRQDIILYPYGESQNDFAQRITKAMQSSLEEDMAKEKTTLFVTHRGGMREILNLAYAANHNLPVSQTDKYEMSGMKYCDFIEVVLKDRNQLKAAMARRLKELWEKQQQR